MKPPCRYPCHACNHTTSTLTGLETHIRREHQITSRKDLDHCLDISFARMAFQNMAAARRETQRIERVNA